MVVVVVAAAAMIVVVVVVMAAREGEVGRRWRRWCERNPDMQSGWISQRWRGGIYARGESGRDRESDCVGG